MQQLTTAAGEGPRTPRTMTEVEAALTVDPGNTELQRLKVDLEQVISLTRELLGTVAPPGPPERSCDGGGDQDSGGEASDEACRKTWVVGDKCLAPSGDGQYRKATVEDVTEDLAEVCVVFDHSGLVGVAKPRQLRELGREEPPPPAPHPKKHRGLEGVRRRKHKRLQFYRKLEQQREAEKDRWQAFLHGNQAVKKMTTKSIFASPETESGRVGIGTCGHSGRPMTEYHTCDKPLKRM
ncbi:survival of motor neuron-related-splicing factor 30-like isoform X2 [Bacillus rossius redtenbacheri]|uniref:survival of motor neuron-related-splicing factor 30-like isoform X2 n=1 Tax=Bacillus rossius redtenbacheri TaxID=93214 RepID=UPI002FDE4F8C